MPNHITNILKISGNRESTRTLFEAIKNDKVGLGSLDFEKVIPMPKHIFRGPVGMAERKKWGENNWYDWSILNWGTKWNSYGYDNAFSLRTFDGKRIKFLTAWNCPAPVIAVLAAKYPDISFEHKWADENFGYNVGERKYENGVEIFCDIPPDGSKKALELAAENILKQIWNAYGKFSSFDLESLARQSNPWIEKRKELENNKMRKF